MLRDLGVDFLDTQWPDPWTHQAVVALHGEFATWLGAKVVSIGMDPATGMTLPSSSVLGKPTGAMKDLLTGWDDGQHAHGRPADVTVSRDGRLFVANDNTGEIFWVAPVAP